MRADHLARFRADPSKVRVSVRKRGDSFLVTIAERAEGGRRVQAQRPVCRSALYRALLAASKAGLDGIDMGMGCTYPHPQRRGVARERSVDLH